MAEERKMSTRTMALTVIGAMTWAFGKSLSRDKAELASLAKDPSRRAELTDSAMSYNIWSNIGLAVFAWPLLKKYPKTTIGLVGASLLIDSWLSWSALPPQSRRKQSIFSLIERRTGRAAHAPTLPTAPAPVAAPVSAGYGYGPSVSPSYPGAPFVESPFAAHYPDW